MNKTLKNVPITYEGTGIIEPTQKCVFKTSNDKSESLNIIGTNEENFLQLHISGAPDDIKGQVGNEPKKQLNGDWKIPFGESLNSSGLFKGETVNIVNTTSASHTSNAIITATLG